MKHWTDEHMDRLEKAEEMFSIAYKALLELDENGFCCQGGPGFHAKDCLLQMALRKIIKLQKEMLPGEVGKSSQKFWKEV